MSDKLSLILFLAVLISFNIMAFLILSGRNPVLGAGLDFFHRKWRVTRHRHNRYTTVFGYLWAGFILLFDLLLLRAIVWGGAQ